MFVCDSVLRRLVTLVNHQATLIAQSEAAQKQATSATDAAKRFMEESENKVVCEILYLMFLCGLSRSYAHTGIGLYDKGADMAKGIFSAAFPLFFFLFFSI